MLQTKDLISFIDLFVSIWSIVGGVLHLTSMAEIVASTSLSQHTVILCVVHFVDAWISITITRVVVQNTGNSKWIRKTFASGGFGHFCRLVYLATALYAAIAINKPESMRLCIVELLLLVYIAMVKDCKRE